MKKILLFAGITLSAFQFVSAQELNNAFQINNFGDLRMRRYTSNDLDWKYALVAKSATQLAINLGGGFSEGVVIQSGVGIGNFSLSGNFTSGYGLAIGDSDTGIKQMGDGKLAFFTNNVERLRINNNGNVGIGTDSPRAKLHVEGDNIILNRSGNGGYFRFEKDGVRLWEIHSGFGNDGIFRLRHGSDNKDILTIGKNGAGLSLNREGSNYGQYINFLRAGVQKWQIHTGVSSDDFRIRNAAQETTFKIDQLGKVGIGTDDPDSKLEMYGYSPVLKITQNPGAAGGVGVVLTGAGPGSLGIKSFVQFHNGGAIWGQSGGVGDDRLEFGKADKSQVYMTLLSGKLGIGTTDPKNELSVNGTIWAREVKIQLTDAGDWVFDESYHLRPLNEVADYIKENKHLPEIPSAQEFRENDLKVSEMTNKLLVKIEELTLYTIDQEKKINAQEEKEKSLEERLSKLEKLLSKE